MRLSTRHDWHLTPAEAIALQHKLAREIVADHPIDLAAIKLVAGLDVSVRDGLSQAAMVVMTYPGLESVETVRVVRPTPFPYIPGLLNFREGPLLVEVLEKARSAPDAFLFDGMGIAHPRRLGIASHVGLWLQRPTVGCGKSRLCGSYDPPAVRKGASTPLVHRDEIVGVALRTRAGARPIFVSPGHLADLPSAAALVLACSPKYRLPEPIRMAHNAASLHRGVGTGA